MNGSHSTSPSRNPQRGARVLARAFQQAPFASSRRISEEALRIVDRRVRSPRSWWQRVRDRYDASPLLQAITVGLAIYACGALILIALLLLLPGGWVW